MKIHYTRNQRITRLKTGENILSNECKSIAEVGDRKMKQIIEEVMAAAEADHYDVETVHIFFKKRNKRREKRQNIHIYKWD